MVDALALAKIRHSKVLAVDPSIFGRIITLPLSKPATEFKDAKKRTTTRASAAASEPDDGSLVAVVAIDGPLAQRAYLDMELCGVVDGYDAIADRFAEAITDPKVGAVVLRINSPGGDVAGCEEAVARMRKMADAQGKHVVAFADELAASAAYWIASGVADEIVLPISGEVGSVGCIGAYVDSTGALEQAGHKVTIVRDPEGKAAAHPLGPVHDVAHSELVALVTEVTKRFMAAVSKRRDVETSELRELNGRVLHGRRAVKAGLADEVGSFETAIGKALRAVEAAKSAARKQAMGKIERDALGVSEDATEEQIARAGEERELGAFVLELADSDDPATARGRLASWKSSAAETAKLRAERDEANQARERSELSTYLHAQVGKKLYPAQAWAQTDGVPVAGEPHARWVKMGHGETKAFVDELPPLAITVDNGGDGAEVGGHQAVTPDGVDDLTAEELALCDAKGIDPKFWAASKSKQAERRAAKGI